MYASSTRVASSLVLILALVGCARNAPPSLSPAGVVTFQANQALLALDSVQHAAIGLNKIQKCETAVPPTNCQPALSDANTKIVVDLVADGVRSIRQIPSGWKAAVSTTLATIGQRLDQNGKTVFGAYIQAAGQIIASI